MLKLENENYGLIQSYFHCENNDIYNKHLFMWSQYKPPVTNWLVLKFFNYWTRLLTWSQKKLNLLKVMAYETNSIFLKKNWIFDRCKINNFFFFKNLNFLTLSLPLTFFSFHFKNEKNFHLQHNLTYNFYWCLIIDIFKFFFNWNIKKVGWSLNSKKNYLFYNFFFKSILFNLKKNIFNINLLNLWMLDYNFFYNPYYYNLVILLKQLNLSSNHFFFYKIYYFGIFVTKFLVQNFFEWKMYLYNKYLSMQKGFSKRTKFFINRHYLFSTSTQISKKSINFVYKYFYKNIYTLISQKNLNFFFKKKESANYDKLTSKSGIFLWNWNLPILPLYVNKIFFIYNGNWFFKLRIVPAMVGYKFGSFSFTWRILVKDNKVISLYKNVI